MRALTGLCAAACLLSAAAPAAAGEHSERCFDKGKLKYYTCPKPKTTTETIVIEKETVVVESRLGYNWTGVYIGLYGGVARGGFDGTFDSVGPNSLPLDDLTKAGFAGGALIGFNIHFENDFVFGLELDGGFTNIDSGTSNVDGETARAEINALGAARARFGYSLGRVMPYLSAGVGFVSYEATVTDDSGSSATFDDVAVAPVIGGGLNFMVTESFIAGFDFSYYFTDEANSLTGVTDADAGDEVKLDSVWSVRGTLNYRF